MTYTFNLGIPSGVIITKYGLCTVRHLHSNGDVDLYMGHGRVFTVSGDTEWDQPRARDSSGRVIR